MICLFVMNFKVALLLLFCQIINANAAGYNDYEFILEKCCEFGTTRARQLPIAGCNLSNSSFDRISINSEYREQCELVMQICCVKEHRSLNCEQGKTLAKTSNQCNKTNSMVIVTNSGNDSVHDCCLSCKLGILAANQHFPCAFSAHGSFSLGNPWEDTYYECCIETKAGDNAPLTNVNIKRSEATLSFCETASPCAHYCYDSGNIVGSFQCTCFKGYQLENDGRNCADIDECDDGTHNCDPDLEQCVNNAGGFQCLPKSSETETPKQISCNAGYKWSTKNNKCSDIDECMEGSDNCNRKTQLCRNTLGSFTCLMRSEKCPPGFKRGPNGENDCIDIDECAENQFDCFLPEEQCVNSHGNYYCEPISNNVISSSSLTTKSCERGFRFSKVTQQCEDIDECRIGQHTCNLATHKCINNNGSYICSYSSSSTQTLTPCASGYARNRWSNECEDINECEFNENPCPRSQTCQNTIGSYQCHCQTGFAKDAITKVCKDINECQLGIHNCHHTLRCDNTIGSFDCVRVQDCGTGYTINAETDSCEDVDECELGKHDCGEGFQCRNIAGTYRCERISCPYNYHLVDGMCKLIDCGTGREFNETLKRCADINECLQFPCRSSEKCVNTVGSFRCVSTCTPGYQLNVFGNGCEDIDECALGTHECKSTQICKNRPGNYHCECPTGHSMNQYRECEDINECSRYGSSVCSPDTSECRNTKGSYECVCKLGFEGDGSGRFCKDINECETSNACAHKCFNTFGSYLCVCETGYKLAENNRSCVDIDECEVFNEQKKSSNVYLCIGICENIAGSFQCSCPRGYRLAADKRTCQDINECEETNVCKGDDEVCLNTKGGYKCNRIDCPPGYQRDRSHKSRCKRAYLASSSCDTKQCLNDDLKEPLSLSYNYLTFVSNITIPSTGYLDLFTMRGPVLSVTTVEFDLNLLHARIGKYGIPEAKRDDFHLRRTAYNEAMISLVKSLQGPQDIELELEVKLHHNGLFGGSSKALLFVYVSEYEY